MFGGVLAAPEERDSSAVGPWPPSPESRALLARAESARKRVRMDSLGFYGIECFLHALVVDGVKIPSSALTRL
jgi:hypothetical protein